VRPGGGAFKSGAALKQRVAMRSAERLRSEGAAPVPRCSKIEQPASPSVSLAAAGCGQSRAQGASIGG